METKTKKNSIAVCVGSSCFSRGNDKNLEIIQNYLKEINSTDEVELRGCLCQDKCNSGPNITINGKLYTNVDPRTITDILNHKLIKE